MKEGGSELCWCWSWSWNTRDFTGAWVVGWDRKWVQCIRLGSVGRLKRGIDGGVGVGGGGSSGEEERVKRRRGRVG